MILSAPSLQHESSFQQIREARRITDDLFSIVREDALYARPVPERHRIIFYIGHLEAFDWNLLNPKLAQHSPQFPDLDKLFAFGIDPVDGGLPKDTPADWPALHCVQQYIAERRRAIDDLLSGDRFPNQDPQRQPASSSLLHVALEHRLMHAETLAYMLHQLPYNAKKPPINSTTLSATPIAAPPISALCTVPTGISTLGLRSEDGLFGWDNEFQANVVFVPSFRIDKYMVTNAQFLEFMNAGGYSNSEFWTPQDWHWRLQMRITHPVFWEKDGSNWSYRGMFEGMLLPFDWPVYVSHAEAAAYAKWADKALPTEAQWHRAAYGTRSSLQRSYPWGEESPANTPGNFDFRRWDPAPVTTDQEANQGTFGVVGLLGNGWEWTSTPFAPFPGFQAFCFYPGYSADFFDGKHFVLKGGSARTAAPLLRRSFRNWFQPHYQYMYAGFRCVSKTD